MTDSLPIESSALVCVNWIKIVILCTPLFACSSVIVKPSGFLKSYDALRPSSIDGVAIYRADLPPQGRTDLVSKKSVFRENDGYEKEPIYRRTNYQLH
jgi:hypothetical protein